MAAIIVTVIKTMVVVPTQNIAEVFISFLFKIKTCEEKGMLRKLQNLV